MIDKDKECIYRFGHTNWGFLDTYTKDELNKKEHIIEDNIVYWIDDFDVCNRCNDTISPCEEIWYPKGEVVCEVCITSKEIDNYMLTDNHKENK